MPTYEFYCGKCDKEFSISLSEYKEKDVECPDCGEKQITRRPSVFTAQTSQKS